MNPTTQEIERQSDNVVINPKKDKSKKSHKLYKLLKMTIGGTHLLEEGNMLGNQ